MGTPPSDRAVYLLKRGEVVLGELAPYDYDFPWERCRFAATPAFAPYRPLFARESELLALNDRDEVQDAELERIWQQLAGLGLVLEPAPSGERLHNFDLHVDGDLAEFRRAFG
jgi:hypothetical protein